MDKRDVIEFIRENPVCSLATAINNQPFVRIMRVIRADENGIVFNTKRFKPSFKELTENPQVEFCFYCEKKDIQIRVRGTVSSLEDLTMKKQIVSDFPKLTRVVEKHGIETIVPFTLKTWDYKICTRH